MNLFFDTSALVKFFHEEEKDLLDSYERGEWKSVKNLKQEIQKHKE